MDAQLAPETAEVSLASRHRGGISTWPTVLVRCSRASFADGRSCQPRPCLYSLVSYSVTASGAKSAEGLLPDLIGPVPITFRGHDMRPISRLTEIGLRRARLPALNPSSNWPFLAADKLAGAGPLPTKGGSFGRSGVGAPRHEALPGCLGHRVAARSYRPNQAQLVTVPRSTAGGRDRPSPAEAGDVSGSGLERY